MRIVLLMEDGFLCIRGMERAGKEKQTSQSIFFKVFIKQTPCFIVRRETGEKYP